MEQTGPDGAPARPEDHPAPAPAPAAHAAGPYGTWPWVERRARADRRHRPTSLWDSLVHPRRRRSGRRTGEKRDIYVDVFQRRDVLLMVAIFVLNIFDALFTLLWLQRGGGEGNPLMAWLLEHGNEAFLLQKCLVVGLWLVLLVVHKNFRLARLGLWSLASLYALLVAYHLVLIGSGADPRGRAMRREALELRAPDDPPAPIILIEPLDLREQRRHHGLDAQRAGSEARGSQPGGAQPLELELAPTALGSDRHHGGRLVAG